MGWVRSYGSFFGDWIIDKYVYVLFIVISLSLDYNWREIMVRVG